MRIGHLDGRNVVYDENGHLILEPGERLLRHVAKDNLDLSEGSSVWNMKMLFSPTPEKGDLYLTSRRLVFIRKPNPSLAFGAYSYPYGIPDALASAYKASALKRQKAFEFCEIALSDVKGYWVKKRTCGIVFLEGMPGRTRKAILYQRGREDDKLTVLRDLLKGMLPVTEPEDKKGSYLLGERYPFLRRRRS